MNLERGIFNFRKFISISGFSSVAGEREAKGPLGYRIDRILKGRLFGEKTFEKAESKMQQVAVIKAMQNANLTASEIDAIFAGDLLNQCIGSNYGLRELAIPFVGVYGACSTMAEAILVAAIFIESGHFRKTISVTSSHFCAAERQFRFPLEYGGQRPKTSQWTVTAAGAVLLEEGKENGILIKGGCIGRIVDFGIKDINNMGAAMAPAAADTIVRFFKTTRTSCNDYDLILTGDLGEIGSKALIEILKEEGFNIEKKHKDCGLLIYNKDEKEINCGGSGPGCSALVLCSDILKQMQEKKIKNLLFIATGALMSKRSSQQGESIPAVAHLVYLEGEEKWS